MSRVSGSVAFGAAARTVIGFARDPDDPEGEQGRERVLVHGKSNWGRYATSLAARIESRDVLTDDGVADTGLLVITGESSIGVDDLQRDREERSAGEEAAAFPVEVLAGGPVAAVDVKREADECGIAERTLARAKRDLKVRSIKGGLKSGWTWELPPKDAKNAEGCHVQDTASFGNVGILRDATEDEEAELERIQTSTAQGWIGGGQGVSPYRERPLDPPSATVEEEAELERLRDKFPELEELAQRCRCDSPVVGVDDDGDPVCAKCGRAS